MTTSHSADDPRIFDRECRSLAATGDYDVFLAAAGAIPDGTDVSLIRLTARPGSRLGRFTAGPRKASALARAIDADLWHFHDPELLPVALRLARSGQAVIWDAHEDYAGQFTPDGGKNWIPKPALGAARAGTQGLLKQVDTHAAGVVAATPTIASRYSNPRTVVVGNEARLELFSDCKPQHSSKQLLFTGSNPSAGQLFQEVVEAVAQIPDTHLAVAGRAPTQAVWSQARAVLGDRLVHLGWLSRTGIADAISASSVGFSTYADIPSHAENSPNKLFEFGAAGLPVVATPTRSNVHYLSSSGAGVLASGYSSKDLAEAVCLLLADKQKWEAASAAGRQWASRDGSWTTSEARLVALYSELLTGDQAK